MDSVVIAWSVAGLASFGCLGLFLRSRSEGARAEASGAEARATLEESRNLRKQLEKQSRKQEGRGDETANLRRRLEKAKKRAAHLQGERRQEPERMAALERDLEARTAELRSAREELGDLGSELLRAQAQAEAPKTPSEPVVSPPPAELAELAGQHEEELQALRSKLSEVQSELSESRREALQARSRIKTQDKLYLAMRGDLEAKKDRLKQQQEELERLLAMRATLLGASGPATGSDGRGDSLGSVEAEARGQGGEVEPAAAEASPADS